jgi:hypothetical protein
MFGPGADSQRRIYRGEKPSEPSEPSEVQSAYGFVALRRAVPWSSVSRPSAEVSYAEID